MSDRKVDLTERQWKMQLHAAHLAGASRERAAVVAWLRSEACFYWLLRNTGGFTRDQAPNLSDAIERGEHIRDDDE